MTGPLTADQAAGFLRQLYDTAVQRALPAAQTAAHLPPPPPGRTVVIGAGKAGGAMAEAVDRLWPATAPMTGLVITRYDHVPPSVRERPGRIEVVEAAHPVPDAAGLAATARIMALVQGLTADDLVLCLISGGGSSLLTSPAPGLTLDDKRAINQALLNSGAAIGEMNTVRKHLSAVKGGRLAALSAPARVVTLLISDVPGDAPEVIASGPTVPDASTCADALAILQRYAIPVPPAALQALQDGALETPKPGDPTFEGHSVRMLCTPQESLEAAAAAARAAGIEAHILSDEIEGESRDVGQVHAALARAVARRGQPFSTPCVILSGGETTVTVKTPPTGQKLGRGGRATEFLLGCAQALQAEPGVWVLAADTDGIDGLEDNAGALVTPTTLARAAALGLKPANSLALHDGHGFFSALGDLVVPGPTFTNVNDFRAVLVVTPPPTPRAART